MADLVKQIENASDIEINDIWFAVKKRYSELFPDWEIIMVPIEKPKNINEQLDNLICFLERLKRNYNQSSDH